MARTRPRRVRTDAPTCKIGRVAGHDIAALYIMTPPYNCWCEIYKHQFRLSALSSKPQDIVSTSNSD